MTTASGGLSYLGQNMTAMRWGTPAEWDPDEYRRAHHADVQVVETTKLQPGVLGCVDHERRIIYLAAGMDAARRRSTYAYELAELQQGPAPADPCLAAARRRAALDWAALMLVSSEAFAAVWADCFLYRMDLVAMAAAVGVDTAMFRARIRAASDLDQDAAIEAIGRVQLSA